MAELNVSGDIKTFIYDYAEDALLVSNKILSERGEL